MLEPGCRILISACLVGCKCNYKASEASVYASDVVFWNRLFELYRLLPVCPEQLGGMPTPRVPCEIKDSASLVLQGAGHVFNREGLDTTACFIKGAEEALRFARLNGIELAVMKSRSPSCGVNEVYDGTFSGRLVTGSGVAARALLDSGFKVVDEFEFSRMFAVHSVSGL
ncbi:MAG: hypothetical protein CVV41_18360 [Candidatus Riflebacteria bacterium HGW-Riflebacteria-1]|jgi:uncharacterized protein YbbK (DUF523 family)|nr:MAG: hypothetical protein CVV41_18360 [Candidatus Riflebacteria bacterium HGW-Riflebacteria-1]